MPRHLVTSALPCTDGGMHLGNLVGSMLPADVYSRFLRARGEPVLFVCASGEHGTPSELAAAAVGLDIAEYCDQRHQAQVELAAGFGISCDVFGRSSSPQNRQQTQYFARRLEEEGYVEARSARQVFSPADGRPLADHRIVGTCPHCEYDGARGDQCEDCGQLLDATELIDPRSAVSGSEDLQVHEGRHLFLLRSKLVGELRAWLESKSDWPAPARSIGLEWLDAGLDDRSITRDLSWGVPVDRSDFEGDVYYMWFDAPIAYIGATREWADAHGEPDAWRQWWCASEDVRYAQFTTKESLLFHTVWFPCILMGTREAWKLVDALKAFDRLTYYGERLSAGHGVGVFMDQALDLLPADCWRYYLMANAPEGGEVSFAWEALAAAVNGDLVDGFGAFVDRALGFAQRGFGGAVPSGGIAGDDEAALAAAVDARIAELTARISAFEFREAVAVLRAAWSCGSAYLDSKPPPAALTLEEAALMARTCVNLVALLARLSTPLIPFTAERVFDALRLSEEQRLWPTRFDADALGAGHGFSLPIGLFHRIEDGEVKRWREV